MCGRFALAIPPKNLSHHFQVEEIDLQNRLNIAPGQKIMVIHQSDFKGPRRASYINWGLIPHWSDKPGGGKKLINARGETIWSKPSFKESAGHRRCLIPATGFYEWDSEKQPYIFEPVDRSLIAMGGLWDTWEDPVTKKTVRSCAVITTRANGLVAPIHERMPVIIQPDSYYRWLDPELHNPGMLKPLIEPVPDDFFDARKVDRRYSNPAYEPDAGTLT